MKTVPCRSCQAPMFWVTMEPSGKKNPLDPEPSEKGNIRMTDTGERWIVLKGDELVKARERGDKLHLSHFATCPNSLAHRKKQ